MANKKIHFYADGLALMEVLNLKVSGEGTDVDFTLDMIDDSIQFTYSETQNRLFEMYGRSLLGVNKHSPVSIECETLEEGPILRAEFNVEEEMQQYLASSYQSMFKLSRYIKANKLDEEYADLDEFTEGILIYKDNDGSLQFKRVKGKERPYLLCFSPKGIEEMGRPYRDELTEARIEELKQLQAEGCAGTCSGCSGCGV